MIPERKKNLIEECWDALDTVGSTDRPLRHWLLRCLGIIMVLGTAALIVGYFVLPIYIWVEWQGWWKWVGGVWTCLNAVGFFAFITQDGFSDGG